MIECTCPRSSTLPALSMIARFSHPPNLIMHFSGIQRLPSKPPLLRLFKHHPFACFLTSFPAPALQCCSSSPLSTAHYHCPQSPLGRYWQQQPLHLESDSSSYTSPWYHHRRFPCPSSCKPNASIPKRCPQNHTDRSTSSRWDGCRGIPGPPAR